MFPSLIYFDNLTGSGVKFYLCHKRERIISWTLGSFTDVGLIKTVFLNKGFDYEKSLRADFC